MVWKESRRKNSSSVNSAANETAKLSEAFTEDHFEIHIHFQA